MKQIFQALVDVIRPLTSYGIPGTKDVDQGKTQQALNELEKLIEREVIDIDALRRVVSELDGFVTCKERMRSNYDPTRSWISSGDARQYVDRIKQILK